MFYKLGKKVFEIFINFLKFTQVFLIFLSFFVILYWLLQLGGATYLEPVAPFFEGIKDITHVFYNRIVTIDEVSVDFSFLIAAFTFLLVVWILKFIIEDVELVEKKYDSACFAIREKSEKLFNVGLEKQYLLHEHKNNKFLLYIKFNAINLAKDSLFDKDAAVGVEEKQNEVMLDFLENLSQNLKFKKNSLGDGFLLYFAHFNEIDNVLFHVENILAGLRAKYRAEKWQINSVMSMEPYFEEKELAGRVKNLIALAKLGLKGEVVVLGTFKQRYALIKTPQFYIEGKGVYKIEHGEEEVFCIKLK